MLHQLVYTSEGSLDIDEAMLKRIADTATNNNAGLGITGLLLHSKGHFIQLLEGDSGMIAGLYSNICRDPRHQNCRVLYFGPAEKRLYTGWCMGVFDLDGPGIGSLDITELQSMFAATQTVGTELRHAQFVSAFECFRTQLDHCAEAV